ncbi:MAG: thioredoxin [Bacteroidetes bacterium HGW-Bacteroidetes-4]|jgi:thioredoxin 1|nr:MAG: thioredoxin [Bacteroidetes bacterium HGW-Bacteroidetes-4]
MNIVFIIIGALVVVFLGMIVYSYYKMKNTPDVKNSEQIKILTPKNIGFQMKQGTILIDYWAAWCAPCKMMAPVLNEIAEEQNGRLTVGKVNVEQYQQLASKYKIKNLPTLVLFQKGKEVHRIIGFKNKRTLMKEIEPFLN